MLVYRSDAAANANVAVCSCTAPVLYLTIQPVRRLLSHRHSLCFVCAVASNEPMAADLAAPLPDLLFLLAPRRYRGRDATIDRKKVSPARHALVVRRISTKFEHLEKKGWLRNTLYRVFHRPDEWKVVDILVYRTGKHGLACFDCCECFKCQECTAFIVFESPQMPLDIIRRHRDATQKAWLTVLLSPLKNTCGFCWFICAGCCPKLPCRRSRNASPRASEGGVVRLHHVLITLSSCFLITFLITLLSRFSQAAPISTGIFGMETIFGRSPDTDKLAMRKWELQPGPTKEDLKGRADSKGRFKNLNRPKWQKTLTAIFGACLRQNATTRQM